MRTSLFPLTSLCALGVLCGLSGRSFAENAASPLGEPVLDPPTLHSLGVYWIIQGDDNRNASVQIEYRKQGGKDWRNGFPLFRVEKGAHKTEKYGSKLDVPASAWLFAGSVVLLEPGTAYELKLKLADPDGGEAEKVLQAKTISEPQYQPEPQAVFHVVPGSGGGNGSAQDPFKGLDAAQKAAQPGSVFLLHAGVYEGTFTAAKSGEPDKPIVWRGAGDGEAVLDGQGKAKKRPGRGVSAGDIHDVWFEKLTIRNADYGLVAHRSQRIVIRRCHIHACEYGVTWTNNDKGNVEGFFVSDNVIEGPSTWPRTKGIENARGIQATGAGHAICYNRVQGFGDAIDTFPSRLCAAIDFHNNDVNVLTDDGFEMDYSERNTRCFHNRLTNVFQGISLQPVFGGPVYVFRNVMYNVCVEPFKLHNSPSGGLIFHNTIVKKGAPTILSTSEKVHNCVSRNNLFIGTTDRYAFENSAPMADCDFDCDGFGGGPFDMFLKWNNVRYKTFDEVKAKAPCYRHAVLVDPATVFASGAKPPEDEKQKAEPPDLRLKPGTAAIDAGDVLPGFNDGFTGKAPDLGACELDAEWPHYGPRPEK